MHLAEGNNLSKSPVVDYKLYTSMYSQAFISHACGLVIPRAGLKGISISQAIH